LDSSHFSSPPPNCWAGLRHWS